MPSKSHSAITAAWVAGNYLLVYDCGVLLCLAAVSTRGTARAAPALPTLLVRAAAYCLGPASGSHHNAPTSCTGKAPLTQRLCCQSLVVFRLLLLTSMHQMCDVVDVKSCTRESLAVPLHVAKWLSSKLTKSTVTLPFAHAGA
jgi:hypothetical protein